MFLKSAPEPINNCRKALELEPNVKHLVKCFLDSESSHATPENLDSKFTPSDVTSGGCNNI